MSSHPTQQPQPPAGGPLDAQFAKLLSAYDDLLAKGVQTPFSPDEGVITDPTLAEELKKSKALLERLERVWPRDHSLPGVAKASTSKKKNRARRSSPDNSDDLHEKLSADRDAADDLWQGRFKILRELGRGGSGIVFHAFDAMLERQIALKVPYANVASDSELRRRFVQEARSAARLAHPNIVTILEACETELICYIVSAYCPGPNLAEWLTNRSSPVPARTAAKMIATLAGGVEHAHSRGILHRDIKPKNVMLGFPSASQNETAGASDHICHHASRTNAEPVPHPMLLDFGLAKVFEQERDRTHTGAIIGTPAYMPPEQAEGRHADVGPPTDVYALGAILYELLAGQPPFREQNDLRTLQAIILHELPPAR